MNISRPRLAAWLWIVFAFLVWNAVFDQVVIDAGRHYVEIATASAESNRAFLNIEDTMRPARTRAFWLATVSAAGILVTGLVGLGFAQRRQPPAQRP